MLHRRPQRLSDDNIEGKDLRGESQRADPRFPPHPHHDEPVEGREGQ